MGLDCLPSKGGDSVFVDSLYTSDFVAVSPLCNASLIVLSSSEKERADCSSFFCSYFLATGCVLYISSQGRGSMCALCGIFL